MVEDKSMDSEDNLVTVSFEVDSELYEQAKEVLDRIGLTMEEAINLFLKAMVACGGIPFPITDEEIEEYKRLCKG